MFKEIELKDKEIIINYFQKYPSNISELSFSNLFAWKKYTWDILEDHLIIKLNNKLLQPVGKDPITFMQNNKNVYARVHKDLALKTSLNLNERKDHFDYIYDLTQLREFSGRKFANKRNFIKKVKSLNPEIILNPKNNKILELQEKWCQLKDCKNNPDLLEEHNAIRKTVLNSDKLDVMCIAIKLNKKIEAFAIGEKLNHNTFVEHFEKANPNIKGMPQFIVNEFAKYIPKEFIYLNREQDLGSEGLKKAKMSYYPSHFIEKYDIRHS